MAKTDGKVCLVTNGLYEGVPLACAFLLAQAGYRIAIVHKKKTRRPPTQIASLQRQISQLFINWNREVRFYRADTWKRSEARKLLSQIEKKQGPVDVLINGEGAKAYPHRHLQDFQEKEWDNALNVEIKGALNLILECYPGMKKRRTGYIFNFTNHKECWDNRILVTGGIPARKDSWPFLISKDARASLNRNLALSLHADGISCNNVELGGARALKLDELAALIQVKSQVERELTSYTVATVVAFLCSPAGRFIRGSDIRLPGEIVLYDCRTKGK